MTRLLILLLSLLASFACASRVESVGNRLSRSTTGFAPGLLDPQSFAYDANDRLNTDSYDANGNTLLDAGFNQTQADRYDFENRLIERRSTVASVTRTVNIAYDGDGHRVSKTVNGVATYYLVDDLNPTGYAQVLEELSTLNTNPSQLIPIRLYAYGHDLLSQDQLFDTGTNLVWSASFHGYDGHGSTRYLTDANGNVTDTYDYDAFGNLIAQSGTTPNLYLYSGEQFDPDFGLYYLRARYHNPQTGRFWSMDFFEGFAQDPQSLHKYTYAHNNAFNSLDPSGRSSIPEINITTGLWALARGIYGATIGALGGSLAAGYDSILNGRITDAEIGAAMAQGFREGAIAGGVLGFAGGFGAVGVFGVSSVGLLYSGIGFLAAYQSYLEGNEDAGDFRAIVAGGTALVSVPGVAIPATRTVTTTPGTIRALTRYYNSMSSGLNKSARLTLVFDRLRNSQPPKTAQEALDLITRVMDEIEDAYSGVPKNPDPAQQGADGRMYGPSNPQYIKSNADGSLTATQRGHVTTAGPDGSITIRLKDGTVVFEMKGGGETP